MNIYHTPSIHSMLHKTPYNERFVSMHHKLITIFKHRAINSIISLKHINAT